MLMALLLHAVPALARRDPTAVPGRSCLQHRTPAAWACLCRSDLIWFSMASPLLYGTGGNEPTPQIRSGRLGRAWSDSGARAQLLTALDADNLKAGMRVPGLIRFGAATDAYIGNTNGGPRMYFNIEDHLAHSTGIRNVPFEACALCSASPSRVPLSLPEAQHSCTGSR